MKNQVKFKVGDRVYCPSISSEILNIKVLPSDVMVFDITHSISRNDCGFVSYLNNGAIVRLDNGCCMKTHCQKIVHATQENYELLSKLYPNVTFEPPKPKEPKDVIQAIINSNHKFIACINTSLDVEKHPLDGMGIFSAHTLKTIDYEKLIGELVPFDPKTGKTIIDFVNGEVVLENENE